MVETSALEVGFFNVCQLHEVSLQPAFEWGIPVHRDGDAED